VIGIAVVGYAWRRWITGTADVTEVEPELVSAS